MPKPSRRERKLATAKRGPRPGEPTPSPAPRGPSQSRSGAPAVSKASRVETSVAPAAAVSAKAGSPEPERESTPTPPPPAPKRNLLPFYAAAGVVLAGLFYWVVIRKPAPPAPAPGTAPLFRGRERLVASREGIGRRAARRDGDARDVTLGPPDSLRAHGGPKRGRARPQRTGACSHPDERPSARATTEGDGYAVAPAAETARAPGAASSDRCTCAAARPRAAPPAAPKPLYEE